jgi:hypothetical protein
MKTLDQKTQALDDFVIKGLSLQELSNSQPADMSRLVTNIMKNVYQE